MLFWLNIQEKVLGLLVLLTKENSGEISDKTKKN